VIEHNGTQTILESIFIKYFMEYFIQESGFALLQTRAWYVIIEFYRKTKIGNNVGKLEISQM